jgi:Xaa-Pro aminopeptidase
MSHPTAERLSKIRALMQENNIDYYFIPSRDEHNNEYLPECWERRGYISGFDGSAGDVLIGLNDAYLWTDGRYFLQAEQQLDANLFTLMRQQQGVATPIHEWLSQHAAGKRVATDPRVMTAREHMLWHEALTAVGGALISIDNNLVDAIWNDQPTLQYKKIISLPEKYTGVSAQDKLTHLRNALKSKGAGAHAINLLDAIAWLFNIRGSDIEYNPLAIAYTLVTLDKAILFIDAAHLDKNSRDYLAGQKITVEPYENYAKALQQVKETTLLDAASASWWMEQNLKNAKIIFDASPISLMKAIKNPTEQQGAREAHRRDGLALCKIFHWLENNWQTETELSVSEKVYAFRSQSPEFRGPSFNTISSYAEHGAINHYAVSEETSIPLGDKTPFLLDSGGQYYDGTTDVTRTVHFGTPSADIIHQYTLILKGHLALRHTVFPAGTCGEQLNSIAHLPLWSEGLDFGHGTGHGVGSYLCVHEGPQRISNAYTHTPIVPGMIVSNEPGFYIGGSHGFRIENLVLAVPKFTVEQSKSGHGPFYTFEDLTLAPYARNMIDKSLLSSQEIQWIDVYHQEVYEKLHADLPQDVQTWLKDATQPL